MTGALVLLAALIGSMFVCSVLIGLPQWLLGWVTPPVWLVGLLGILLLSWLSGDS